MGLRFSVALATGMYVKLNWIRCWWANRGIHSMEIFLHSHGDICSYYPDQPPSTDKPKMDFPAVYRKYLVLYQSKK